MSDEAKEALKRVAPWAKLAGYLCVIAAALALLKAPSEWTTWALVEARAQAQTDASTAPLKADVVQLKATDEKLDARLGAVERSTTRTEAMVELLLKDREIRPPPKVALDGGP